MTSSTKTNPFRKSGIWILAGASFLIIELFLIQTGQVTLELPDHKVDRFSLILAIITWSCLAIGLFSISRTKELSGYRKITFPALIGLITYAVGCIVVLLEVWSLLFIVPAGLLVTAAGMIAFGIVAIKRILLATSLCWAILLVGLFPFLFMFPVVAIQGAPNYSVNYSWGFLWAFLGLKLISHQRSVVSLNEGQC